MGASDIPRGAGTDALSREDVAILELLDGVSVPLCRPTIRLNVGVESAVTLASCQRLAALGLVTTEALRGRGYEITPKGEDYLAGNVRCP